VDASLEGAVEAYAARGEFGTTFPDGLGYFNAEASALGADASFSSGAHIGLDGASVNTDFNASVYALRGAANAHFAGVDASAQGEIGASIDGSVNAVYDPYKGQVEFKAEAEAFAGAKIEGQVSTNIGPLKIGLQGEASAGVGAGGKADIGINENGIFRADLSAFAAVGIGVGGGGFVELDVPGAVDSILDISKAGLDLLF